MKKANQKTKQIKRKKIITANELATMISNIDKSLSLKIEKSIDGLALMVGRGFAGVDVKFAQMDERFDRMDERMDRMEMKLDSFGLEQRVKVLEVKVA